MDAIEDNHTEATAIKKQIFLSYCHTDKSVADLIDNSVSSIISEIADITRDVRDVKYKESFRRFMETIGTHDYVIMIISDSYLKSQNCLYEMLEVSRDRKYHNKLLFIVLSDKDKTYYEKTCSVGANIYDMLGQSQYITFWQNKATELKDVIKKIADPVLSIEQSKELKIIQKIQLDLPEFMAYLKEHKGLGLSELNDSNFQEFIDWIK